MPSVEERDLIIDDIEEPDVKARREDLEMQLNELEEEAKNVVTNLEEELAAIKKQFLTMKQNRERG